LGWERFSHRTKGTGQNEWITPDWFYERNQEPIRPENGPDKTDFSKLMCLDSIK